MKNKIYLLIACLFIFVPFITFCGGNLEIIESPHVFTISAPAAGNYPQGLYKYPYKQGSPEEELFTQTIEWSPPVSRTFQTNTKYTAVLTLEPVNRRHTFAGLDTGGITGLPSNRVENITFQNRGRNLVIQIEFETTSRTNAAAQIIFQDDFNGNSLDGSKWELCPEWDRQGRSSWRDDMVSVSGGMLRLKFMRDPQLGASRTRNRALADNWIRAGAVRTLTKDWPWKPLFENNYGYYEARIKFPVVSGTWGAFWLMSRTQGLTANEGMDGTEIDIIETIGNDEGRYNGALHWNGYGSQHKSAGSDDAPLPVNIYDGEFHIIAFEWSPSEYIFYVDGTEFWRVDGGARFRNSGINQNPNYIKLTVEGADWAGLLPDDFTEAEMLVDYVRVYNQPRN
jgi:beta-glucanase (GH16 family)